ncbi:MAG: hypothetical protein ACOZIN_22545 [Myxococcota bacterium]
MTPSSFLRALWFLSLCGAIGCGSSIASPGDAGGGAGGGDGGSVTNDAGGTNDPDAGGGNVDAGVDGGATQSPPAPGQMGGACTANSNCQAPATACHLNAWGTPGGMCTVFCSMPNDPVCPAGSLCGCTPGVTGQCTCIVRCTSSSQCRTADGYTCCSRDQACIPTTWCN